ncbi:sensor histidine kinase [Lewinella sp. IMCC34191]|uniref:sensor histidine kinase n=1 Tax=Lewinella sp. IMCC34191 TaxID=2259172 RepID=UPI000E24933B|nr:histidine kinase dimerization/phosphoacceptor domain -containing protein [Lewinella sp. IMCC34191]
MLPSCMLSSSIPVILIAFLLLCSTDGAGQSKDSAESQLIEIQKHYYVHVDTAVHRARALLPAVLDMNDPYLSGLAYETIARYYLDNGIQDSSRLLLQKARHHYDQSDRREAPAASLWTQATLASIGNRDAESLLLSQQMADECLARGDDRCLARAYWLMGGAFFYQDQLEEEQRYNALAIDLLREQPDTLYYAGLLISYAMSLHNIGRDSAAIPRMDEAERILKDYDAPALLADFYLHKGILYSDLDSVHYGNALYQKGITYADASGTRIYKALLLNNLAYSANESGDYQRAIELLQEELSMAEGLDDLQYLMDFQSVISTAYAGLGRYDSAYHYLQQASQNYQTYIQDGYDEQLAEVKIAYESSKKEKRITAQAAQLRQQQMWLYTAGAGFLVCLVAGLALIRLSQKLRIRNEENERLVQQKEALVGEVHHRVKNNLQVISSLLKLQSRDLDATDSPASHALRDSQSRVQAMGLIHEKLYLGKEGNRVNMKNYLQELGDTLLDTYALDDRVDIYYDLEDLTLEIDTAIPLGLIVNELVTNSLKHAFPNERKGLVEVSLFREDSYLFLRVTDDGAGKAAPTTTSGTGFGTRLLDMLSTKLRGEIRPIPTVGYGTEIRFTPAKVEPAGT